jgi:hypothetical protein
MTNVNSSPPFVPGFEFLQNLINSTSTAMPNMGQWIAPTINPQELQKRIDELKVVQFWLDQNARMLGATLQALEVQRMTLATLNEMNVPMADLQSALNIPTPSKTQAAPGSAADPMQWWGALTQQFSELATKVVQDSKAQPTPATPPPRPSPQRPKSQTKAKAAVPAKKAAAKKHPTQK